MGLTFWQQADGILPVVFSHLEERKRGRKLSKASTKAKMKYNRRAYKRYEFNLGIDTKLNALVERYKSYPGGNLSELVKKLLCGHFGISFAEGEGLYAQYFITKDGNVPNTELDKYFGPPTAESLAGD